MLTKPYLTGIAGGVRNVEKYTVSELFKRAGANTGNFLFVSALRNILGQEKHIYDHQADIKYEQESFDYIAMSAANWINPDVDLTRTVDFIESTDLPCLLVGLGAQVNFGEKPPKLKKGTERFLKVVSERCKHISVRGPHTQEVLEHYGVTNTWVTGCPSIVGANLAFDPSVINVDVNIQLKDVILQGTRHDDNNKVFSDKLVDQINLSIYRTAFKRRSPLLLQSELPDIYHALGRLNNEKLIEKSKGFLEKVYNAPLNEVSPYLKESAMIFWDVDLWFNELSKFKYLIGNRIHGVVSGLLSGVPSVLLAHDYRTLELAETMNIPHVDLRDLDKFDEATIYSIIDSSDFSKFKSGFSEYKDNFIKFFEANDCKHYL
ncbi:polysaccharide pyruvyl transferase [Neiella marina]|uniref:Polysaccharide pyruvyl transferase n=1 Tax=Neiella marina TaxID=508461 RepID=A0A8J2U5D2_9GAMM|nr:polysaccharide pyruvyl transferase family protein [Neiella marina]GGA78523.1 polysaccharide pyruvyl transferase [Neiella marina]